MDEVKCAFYFSPTFLFIFEKRFIYISSLRPLICLFLEPYLDSTIGTVDFIFIFFNIYIFGT